MNRITITRAVCITIAVIAFTSCGNDASKAGKAPADNTKAYNTVVVSPASTILYYEFPASLQGEDVIEIRPKIDGYVEKIFVDEGATVKRGQLLFRISNPQYEQELRTAEAGIHTAEADVSAAQLQVNKVRPLVEKDIISKFDLESAEYTLQARKAALAQAQATLANARTNVGYTSVTSPANGIIGTLPNKVGSLVSGTSTNPLTTISSAGNVYAYFAVNEKSLLELSRIFKGNTLQEKLKQLPPAELLLADGTLYDQKGRIETASGLITTETGSSNLRATFPNPIGILRSGGSGNIRIPRTIDTALVVPQSATYDLQGKRFVYVVAADSTVINTAVTVMPTPDGQSFVVTEGLKAGDRIVTQGVGELRDGIKIKPRQ